MRALRVSLTALLAGVLLGASAPRMATLLRVVRGPFTQAAELPAPALWASAVALGLGAVAALVVEAVSGRRPAPLLLPALLLSVPAVGLAPRERVPRESAPLLLAGAAAAIRAGGLAGVAAVALPATDFRDRRGRRLPAVLRVLAERAGPVLLPAPGDRPGTLYLALAHGGRLGWLTGLAVASSGEPELIAQAGAPVILRVGEETP